LREIFCAAEECPDSEFAPRLFWQALPPWVRPLAWGVWCCNRPYFQTDFELLSAVGWARTERDLEREISEFRSDGRNATFWRRRLRLRISTRRLRQALAAARTRLPAASLPLGR
jgi:hypothetical protein